MAQPAMAGASNKGVVFSINTDGSSYQKLLDFNGTNGSNPQGNLILSGGVLYGMTYRGGASNNGVIYRINTDGSSYQKTPGF